MEPRLAARTDGRGLGRADAHPVPRGLGAPGRRGRDRGAGRGPRGCRVVRLFSAEEPGYGFVDEKIPELGLAVEPLHRRKGIGGTLLRALMVQAREEGFQSLSLSVAVHNRSRMMYQRVGFERVTEDETGSWTMVVNLYATPHRSDKSSTYPSVPCTRIRCPSRISSVACSTPTTAGKPYSRRSPRHGSSGPPPPSPGP